MIKVFTAFSGYDSQCLALRRLGLKFDLVGWSEIDRAAINAHNAVFPEYAERNLGDIRGIDWDTVQDFDLLTYSSPCTDFSTGGFMRGGEKGSGTRSLLLWEVERAIEIKRPKILLFENVPGIVTEKFIKTFHRWQGTLASLGYTNFAKVLNSKDYNVPQSRQRVYMVSILGNNARYYFPPSKPLQRRFFDMVERDVAQVYYVKRPDLLKHFAKFRAVANGGPVLLGWTRSHDNPTRDVRFHPVAVANTLTVRKRLTAQNYIVEAADRVRQLTPRECLRLMDVDDTDIDKIIASGATKTQLYALAGNSIVVSVLAEIFRKIYIDTENEEKQLTLF